MLSDLLHLQHGMLSRAQALAAGMTSDKIEAELAAGRWRRVMPGVYATFSGPLPRRSQLWAAVLRAGEGAVLSHETAAELVGLVEPGEPIHVTVPERRTPGRIPGVVIHRCVWLAKRRHPTRTPPQTRVEDTIVDLTQSSRNATEAIGWLARAVSSRVTTAERLADAMRERAKLRLRRTLLSALRDIGDGSHSVAELAYLRAVERAHALPRSERQARRETGPTRYDDVRYRRFATRVELDGRAAHPDHERWRDMDRDNDVVVTGDRVLRFGLADLDTRPCQIAAKVVAVLRLGGWTGQARTCTRPGCRVA